MSGHRIPYDMAKGPLQIPDPGASGTIKIDRYGAIIELVSVASETRILAAPERDGILATIRQKTDGGDIAITASAGWNVAGNTVATFQDVGDQLHIISVAATTGYRWEILINTGSVGLA